MKSVELTEATAALKDYAEQLTQEPIVVTRRGKAVAALVRLRPSDLESFLVSESPVFKRIVRQSRTSYKRGGGMTREQIEARLARTRGA
ncbi:MAG: type II toxin-antitoxin system Phd/YefM family antitoxin [Thermoanaerobaculia bacterium]